MINRFEELLHELGRVFDLTLHVDKSHACSIHFQEQITIQLELDISQENLFLFSKLVEIPPGKFRENVLREALKSNYLPDPIVGILSYLSLSNHLVLFQRYPLEILNGDRLAALIGGFLEFGESWRKAIENGQPAPLISTTGPLPSNPFGMRP